MMCMPNDSKYTLWSNSYLLSFSEISPLDYVYGAMDCKIRKMNESEIEAQYILKYIHTTQSNSYWGMPFYIMLNKYDNNRTM